MKCLPVDYCRCVFIIFFGVFIFSHSSWWCCRRRCHHVAIEGEIGCCVLLLLLLLAVLLVRFRAHALHIVYILISSHSVQCDVSMKVWVCVLCVCVYMFGHIFSSSIIFRKFTSAQMAGGATSALHDAMKLSDGYKYASTICSIYIYSYTM